ncbi:nitrite transporter subfamily [Cellvibrio sp. BR]|jgi:NNP family nitrate/nitrite transporter-like MFS transporter|uniref:MFS transporter n=1 Tax=unclassified Cellvibrio TaxID=2624793 RepID=UPI0002601714|nr:MULTISPECIES: MFS transporter [unclassified Cellvibrio]EIK46838.1 nitrite transporter subfamily [Cellvibrio sp. BR]UUA71269.1 MFS transporter [Cellvibrio sp. QJXJ]
MSENSAKMNLLSFAGKTKILHLTWLAFFITFLVWFNHAPLLLAIQASFGLSDQQVKTLLILNVALTIPARIVIGMLVDSFGPRAIYSLLLIITGFLCLFFSLATSFEMLALARFLLGFVGAGFVIGIRMISEWFPARQMGLAEGIYKGLGNIGSAVAALSLPTIALLVGGDDGWRYATGITGLIAFLYAFIYYFSVRDTPAGSTYFKPNKSGGLEVTSKKDFVLYLLVNIPMYGAMALLAWKVNSLGLIAATTLYAIYALLLAIFLLQCRKIYSLNLHVFSAPVDKLQQYKFKQVAILSLAYAVTFGSELAVVSMLPLFFQHTFAVPVALAGVFGACFAAVDIGSCPSGGWISDKFGRKKSLVILLIGAALGFFVMSMINSDWPIALAVAAMMCCSFFLGSAAGCVFAVVPLIRRSLTGQIAGIVGAYGNIGAVVFLTIFSFVSTPVFFLTIAAAIAITALAAMFLEEPQSTMFEVLPDGRVQLVEMH